MYSLATLMMTVLGVATAAPPNVQIYPGYVFADTRHPYASTAYSLADIRYLTPSQQAAQGVKPTDDDHQKIKPVAILRMAEEKNTDGSFAFDFAAENGISSQASGFVKNAGSEAEAQVIQGRYSYISPEGIPITTTYYADESGVHIEGDHLPVAPPVPEAITKSLANQASLPDPAPAPLVPAVYKKP